MNLDDVQRKKVADWIAEGLKLSDIQNRLASDLGIRMTYMEVRLLVDDLKLTPKDAEPRRPVEPVLAGPAAAPARGAPSPGGRGSPVAPKPAAPAAARGRVTVAVDELARPGAVVSGKVTFSDGKTAAWQIDELGRLGLAPQEPGYRPLAADLEQFKMALDAELSKLGL